LNKIKFSDEDTENNTNKNLNDLDEAFKDLDIKKEKEIKETKEEKEKQNEKSVSELKYESLISGLKLLNCK
jgi:hypothetical protein